MKTLGVGSLSAVVLSAAALASLGLSAVEPVVLIPIDGEARSTGAAGGPSGQGAVAGTDYVDTWSSTTNVKWKVPVTGRGHSSPIVWKDNIFLTTATDGGAKMSMLAHRTTDGALLWNTTVPSTGVEHTYHKNSHASATPVTDGQRVYSQQRVFAYDPDTGAELWTVRGNTREVIPTPVVGHGLVFCSSGRAGPTLAIKPGGKGDVTATHVAWSSPRGSPFVPSALVHGDLLYMINDMQSILTVVDARTAASVYQDRLGEPTREGFSSSPVAVGEKLFFTNDRGQTFVVQAGSTFKLLHVNELNAQVLAAPALVDGTWFWRTDKELLAIGRK